MASVYPPDKVQLCDADGNALLSSGVAAVPVNANGYKSTVTITRPANTTAYTAGDAVGKADANTAANAGDAILQFTNIGPSGGHVILTGVMLEVDLTAVPSGMSAFRLHLYDASPDAILDNAAWDLSSAGDRGKYLGYVDIRVPVDLGSTLIALEESLAMHRKLAASSTTIYGVLQTIGAYTPTSGEVYKVTLRALQA